MKKKRKARDKREGLTFSERKRLTRLKRNLAGQGMAQEKPDTARSSLGLTDRTCQVTHGFYTRMVEFHDINYDLLETDDQRYILEEYSRLINYFDPSVKFGLFLFNRHVSEKELADRFEIPPQEDSFNDIREEYAAMLKRQAAKGNKIYYTI